MTGAFLSTNRSKRSLCVDLKQPEGLEIVKALTARADVFIQNFRRGAIRRLRARARAHSRADASTPARRRTGSRSRDG